MTEQPLTLREYLYVDTDRVNGLAEQLYEGIPDKAVRHTENNTGGGVSLKVASLMASKTQGEEVSFLLRDSLFHRLELDLESLGVLHDYSSDLASLEGWNSRSVDLTPGRIVRISAPCTIFHPQQIADALIGMATAAVGVDDLTDETPNPATAKKAAGKRTNHVHRGASDGQPSLLPEDRLPNIPVIPLINAPRTLLAGIIKLTRGMFSDGVHLQMTPAGIEGPAITAHLEPGRRFFDSSPDTLLSRYGLSKQEWTLVGTIGQVSQGANNIDAPLDDDGTVSRAKFVDMASDMLNGTMGLVDLPQGRGFSVVPLALYRTIGEPIQPIL